MMEHCEPKLEGLEPTNGMVLAVFWLIWWRWIFLSFVGVSIIGFVVGFIIGFFDVEEPLGISAGLMNGLIGLIFSTIAGFLVTRMALRKEYKRQGFRILLVPS